MRARWVLPYIIPVHSVAVSNEKVSPPDQEDLLTWAGSPFHARADFVTSAGEVWVTTDPSDWGTQTLEGATPLVFPRASEGFGDGRETYYELLQEYGHALGIHWRPEQHAHCSFDHNGDVRHAVSVTVSADPSGVDVVSFQREELDHYLVASRAVLVRIFDFSLLDFSDFDRWSDDPETTTLDSQDLFFRQKIDERASYTRGVQIIRPSTTKESVVRMIMAGPDDDRFAEFTAVDYRHRTVTTISTDPAATTNNFEHEQNDLPFELSPAFFRPEVLSKYKGDRDKYVIDEERRTIRCRGAWSLRYDVNAARQVHAYICDLRLLPFQEQQYWQSFNENPKANISERAFENDFKGTWTDFRTPLEDLLEIVRHWAGEGVLWWTLRDTSLLSNVNTPHSGSRDEWGRAFKDLADLVVAGFEEAFLRRTCDEAGVAYEDDEKSLALLEKVLRDSAALPSDAGLDGLRTVQRIRSVVAAHVRGGQASKLNREALEAYGTYAAHFWHVCGEVAEELQLIEAALS